MNIEWHVFMAHGVVEEKLGHHTYMTKEEQAKKTKYI